MPGPTIPLVKVWDGTNVQAVKAASTAPLATDPAAVIAISPNSLQANNTAFAVGLPVLPVKFNAAAPTLTEGTAGYISADLAGNVRVIGTLTVNAQKSTTSTVTGKSASATSISLLASNANRIGGSIMNDTTSARLAINCGNTATFASGGYTEILDPGASWEIPEHFTGTINGIWSAAAGFCNVDEYTP